MNILRTLRQPHLALLWASQVFSALGDQLYDIAVLWIAVKVAGSGAGIVAAAEVGTTLLFGLLGGVYADRWNRRVTLIVVDLLRAVAVMLLPLLSLLGILQLWHLIVVAVLVGSLGALFDPTMQASLPVLAEDTKALQALNALMDVTRRLARIIGPGVAGVLVLLLPLPHFFTLDALTFGASALVIFSLGRRFLGPSLIQRQGSENSRKGIFREIGGALRLVSAHTALAWGIISSGISNLAWSIAFVVGIPLLVAHGLGGNIGIYGFIVAAYGVGNVASNLVVGSLTIRRRVATIFAGRLIFGAGFALIAFAPSLWVVLLGAVVAAVGGPMGDLLVLTMIQTDLPSNQIGKVYSLRMTVANLGALLGSLLSVLLFASLNISTVIVLCAIVVIATGGIGLLRFGFTEPVVKLLDSSD